MDVYVVRIYRNPKANGQRMLGCVEIINESKDNIRQFSTTDQLIGILTQENRLRGKSGAEQTMPGISDQALTVMDKSIEGLRHHHHKLPERRK